MNFGGSRNESDFVNYNNLYDGKGLFGDFNSSYKDSSYLAEIGGEIKTNKRLQNSTNRAQVDTMLLYLNGEKYLQDLTLNGGISAQRVISKLNESSSEDLLGGELGIHYDLNSQTTLFASYSRSFVVPNVDLFFDFRGNLNPLIDPATFDTYQIGTKSVFGIHEFSGNVFYINGKDEAYYEPVTYSNKSLDKTRRIGGEAKFTTYFNAQAYSSLSYAYVDATMQGNEGYKGNTIPGVSKHTLSASLNYLPITRLNLGISYKYGSRAYDYDDFDNANTKAPNYQSLNLNASYRLKDFEIYAYVQNLTNHKNAIVVSQSYYPYEFERVFGGGVKYTW